MIGGSIFIGPRPRRLLLPRVARTETAWERARGLLARPAPAEGEGLLITPCNSVHTCFMGFGIDVIFLDRDNVVVKIIRRMQPFRFAMALGSWSVLEIQAGGAERAGIEQGDNLVWLTKL